VKKIGLKTYNLKLSLAATPKNLKPLNIKLHEASQPIGVPSGTSRTPGTSGTFIYTQSNSGTSIHPHFLNNDAGRISNRFVKGTTTFTITTNY